VRNGRLREDVVVEGKAWAGILVYENVSPLTAALRRGGAQLVFEAQKGKILCS
jgi:hypothetical protein